LIWNQTHQLHALREYERHHNRHRPHRGIANARPLNPLPEPITGPATITHLHIRRHDRRTPPRIRTRRLNCTDEIVGTHTAAPAAIALVSGGLLLIARILMIITPVITRGPDAGCRPATASADPTKSPRWRSGTPLSLWSAAGLADSPLIPPRARADTSVTGLERGRDPGQPDARPGVEIRMPDRAVLAERGRGPCAAQ
jgi:hypothetical protein